MKPRIGLLCAAAAILTITACGDGGSKDASPRPPSNKATGAPIRIGLVNTEAAGLGFPTYRLGNQTAAAYINDHLGGVNGRPIEYRVCKTQGTPESAVDCANQMVEAKVAFVQSTFELGLDAMLPILGAAKIPLVGHVAYSRQQETNPNTVFLGASIEAYFAGPLKFYADRGKKSITLFFSERPGVKEWTDGLLKPVADKLGIRYQIVQYNQANPDWNVLAASAMSGKPDVIAGPGLADTSCTALLTALRSVGFRGEIFLGNCTEFIKQAPGLAPGVHLNSDSWRYDAKTGTPPDKRKDFGLQYDLLKEAGHEDHAKTGGGGFSDTMTVHRVLSGIKGEITGPAVLKAFKRTVGADTFAGPAISCDGSAWKGTTTCGKSLFFYEVGTDGKLSLSSNGPVDVSAFAPR
ncbi:ABC transporter substrate-binding protein [Actinomadura sp. B10D3]|uniref:ABC transporter substrate-binding protein n=1 Tax=Actinomadura sp. B10D3 TaxID=3153557 RepID=UPI00325E071A